MAFNLGAFFSSGVKEIGEGFKAKDASVKAEAKASAEAFTKAQESYENEVTGNRNILKKNAKSLQALGINDVGKIRTIISAYGGTDTLAELQKDFTSYQSDALLGENNGQFKTLKEYVNGKISGTGNTFVSDEAAEQAQDEAAIAGDELDIQQAEKKAKAIGVSLEEYLNNQARKMSDRPAFSAKAKAARLVEESSMGLFGKTLTMEEAMQKVTGGQTIGDEAKELGDTGFALAREGGIGPEQLIKMDATFQAERERKGEEFSAGEKEAVRKNIVNGLDSKFQAKTNKVGEFTQIKTEPAYRAAIKVIDRELQDQVNGKFTLDQKSRKIYHSIKRDYERQIGVLTGKDGSEQTDGSKKKTTADAIIEVRKNPKLLEQFVKKFPNYKLPPDLQKEADKLKGKNINEDKNNKEQVIDSEGNAPSKPPSSFLTKPKEKAAREEWDKLYGNDFYPNGKPKPKQK